MKCDKRTMRLYAVTDRYWTGKKTLFEQAEEALRGGITCLQLREKKLAEDEFLDEAIKLRKLCRSYGVPFVVNDSVEIAVKCGADGVHVGQGDMDVRRVREIVGENVFIGVSAQNVGQALEAERSGADYLGVGAVFATSTKLDADTVSFDELKKICRSVSIPVCAIGGINKDNILQLCGSGIDGVALVSAIFASESITDECRRLLELSERVAESED